eukprot:2688369-Amphidinium_carterae.1
MCIRDSPCKELLVRDSKIAGCICDWTDWNAVGVLACELDVKASELQSPAGRALTGLEEKLEEVDTSSAMKAVRTTTAWRKKA